MGDLANQFLTHHAARRDNGEISARTFQQLHSTCEAMVRVLGRGRAVIDLQTTDFAKLKATLATTLSAVTLRNMMQRCRSVFKFAFDEGLIIAPIKFGQSFAKPSLNVVRKGREAHRQAFGDRMFEAYEILQLLAAAKQPMKTIVLLATNGGLGQSDLSSLPIRCVDLDGGWMDFARAKTAVRRRIPLWPETVDAIREWRTMQPKAKDKADNGLLFLTAYGARWVKVSPKSGSCCDALGQEFAKLLRALGIKRPRLSFYGLRHTFETVAGETADQVAVDAIMGHTPQGMAAHYRERIDDGRLQRVTEHVRQWLFCSAPAPKNFRPNADPADPRVLPTDGGLGRTGRTGRCLADKIFAASLPSHWIPHGLELLVREPG